MFEALIHEIQIAADDTVKPTYKLPLLSENDEGPVLNGPVQAADKHEHAVRALPRSVGDTGIEPVTSSV